MFKKLKDKITEEVKSSPQRFAEFTQSVSDKLQNTTTADDVFSIGEDDANTSTNSTDHGFSSVNLVSPSQERVRRGSTSSMASDVSFLPRYESGSMYHLQSDLDDSVSEFEDSASTASSQIGHLSKEQIYSAFQKSQMRYHKYRGRYTDLARHYKDLEREVSKMKSVLVETQDKAIRRVTELKEQCNLEQKAKAHLESALRDEMEEKNIKIQTLQTKIDLLQGVSNPVLLVDIDNKANNSQNDLENLTKYLNDARKEIEVLNERIQEMKANSIVFQSKEQEYKNKIISLEKEIGTFSERERENNLKLAQNKMELHNEILVKDTEIGTLKKENEALRQKVEAASAENKTGNNVKLDNLQSQNKKLIDKVENLSQKCNNLESELLMVEKYKMDIRELQQKNETAKKEKEELQKLTGDMKRSSESFEEKIKELSEENLKLKGKLAKEKEDFDNQISAIREDAKKGLLSLEPKIREKLQNEHLEREEALKQEFVNKIEELSSNNHSLKEVQMQVFQKDDAIKKLTVEVDTLRNDLESSVADYYNLEKNHLELIEETSKLRNTISNLEKERSSLENNEEKISRLEAHIATLQDEVKHLKDMGERKEKDNVFLSMENLNLQQELAQTSQKLRILEEKDEAIQLNSSESKLLELKVQKLEEERKSLLDEFELERKMFNDMLENHKDLKEKEAVIEDLQDILEKTRHEVRQSSELLQKEREKNVMLFDKKHNLELQVTKLQEKVRIFEEKGEAVGLEKSECGLLELKLQKLEEENKRLLQSFEMERVTFANELEDLKQDLSNVQEQSLIDQSIDEPSEDLLKEKLHQIRRLSEAKEKDNVFLSQENLNLQQEKTKLLEKLHLVEEKLESIEMDGTESKLLELKVQKLEEENKGLLDEFEMERKMFNDLLENHRVVREKEEVIEQLEEILDKQRKEIINLKDHLETEKHRNVNLQEAKLRLEEELRKTIEKVRIMEEKDEAISMDKNECNLLEMKLQKLEAENKNLLETFEQERKIFNKAYHDHVQTETQLRDLIEENLQVKQMIKSGKQTIEELTASLKSKAEEYKIVHDNNVRYLKTIEELQAKVQSQEAKLKESAAIKTDNESLSKKLQGLNVENDRLKKEVEDKDKQVSELSKNIENLREVTQKQTVEFNSLLERTKQLDSILEKMQIDSADAVKKEKERQNELTLKIEDLQQELTRKTTEFVNLSRKLEELEKLYAEEQDEYKTKLEEIRTLKKKVQELEALEQSYKMIGEEKQVVDNELVRLKVIETKYKDLENEKTSLENKLTQAEGDFKTKHSETLQKFKVTEQQCNMLKEEKDNLLAELNNLRGKIEDLSLENSNLKATCTKAADTENSLRQLKQQTDALRVERDNSNKEISELRVRISQISSDNNLMVGENQNLMHSNEELKIRLEELEKEKNEFDEIKNKLSEERDTVTKTLEEVRRELSEIQNQNLQLVNDKSRANSSDVDVIKIQQDFYEIKEKCDSLFVENKNLKSEYAKLEEKCNDFDKVKKVLETQINELENQYTEILHERQLLQDEIQELKISPVNLKPEPASKLDQLEILKQEKAYTTDAGGSPDKENLEKQIAILQDKLVQYKSLDITNKSSIDFYENELQKVKSQNDKLNRKLDETLVTLNHCAELSSSTEVEYLKNVLYNYMLGKESLVLARVIAAVCKFDPQQTENVLQREQQKQTLLGQLGLI
ncbi:golgin subfamily A member 4 [Anoplophora glabripennis]|uniref:golgin subfamily A member 4 n=1 Tax=Anoplophora glabripennis TaxID=217634 RepID=UPI000875A175|nr:golgin subfamily A member 4 [Anoplophora glabripennis]